MSTVRLRPLSLVEDGDSVVVGDPETGTFVTVPAVGGVVIEALRRGRTVAEAAAEAELAAGQQVDVAGFVATLAGLGFVDDGSAGRPEVTRTAPIQNRRWVAGARQRLVRPFFGPLAWAGYTVLAMCCAGVFIAVPDLFPVPVRDAFMFGDIGLSALLLPPLSMLTMAAHECGHWLAARAIGLRSRFGIDRRMMLIVFETDLTQVWSVPRRQRYSPLLAGMAMDVVVLSLPLTARLLIHSGRWAAPAQLDAVLAVLVYLKLAGLLWQCMVFLRTDLYAVLVNLLRCHNLWRVKSLMLRRAFGRLDAAGAAELAGASAADRRAARWFRWVWLAGFVGVLGWFLFFLLPVIVAVVRWAATGMAPGPWTGRFWYCLLCAVLALGRPRARATVAGVIWLTGNWL